MHQAPTCGGSSHYKISTPYTVDFIGAQAIVTRKSILARDRAMSMTPQEHMKLLTHRGNEHHHDGLNEDTTNG
jgi:hypothetical protein